MTEPAAFTPGMRDSATHPYDVQEQRVCDYLQKLTPDIGCGDDPVGFLIASHAALREKAKRLEHCGADAIHALRICLANPLLSDGQRAVAQEAIDQMFAEQDEWLTYSAW